MDQDSFRRLLESGSGKSKQSKSRGSFLASSSGAAGSARKTIDASEPAFKPRKVKKSEGKYRDRAAERRVGEGNDYAQIEAVLDDFEKRLENKSATDDQRQYLGGDSEHSILVKGLDHALLEQNKAKASLSTVDDDSLELAFNESVSSVPKKRTREDIIRELKEKKGHTTSAPAKDEALEAAKQQGKFKPIGFKPIGRQDDKPKKKKAKADGGDGERKKKKRKVDAPAETDAGKAEQMDESSPAPLPLSNSAASVPAASSSNLPPEEEDIADDFDIFAGVETYDGLDLGDDDDDDEAPPRKPGTTELEEGEEQTVPRKWFDEEEPKPVASSSKLPLPPPPPPPDKPPSRPIEEDEEEDAEQMRLVPLASSALPSIKDLLAMDAAANPANKWKKKQKKKGQGKSDGDGEDEAPKKKVSTEAKVERDYKRLKNYTDKKGQ
ncbi:hypothetical protein R3P38DRAFT_1064385 [Favolaschia claudopus]|uniref:RED-like N-terminal domain-containing protein n=1 Tax=Favolaschia claudopus TaxID=2862362 RepID=A0AAW0BG47_9AGAR